LEKIYEDYRRGDLLSGELKAILIEWINDFLAGHQKRRAKAKAMLPKFIYSA